MKKSLLSRFEGGLLGSAIALELQKIALDDVASFAPWQEIQDCAIATLIQTRKLASQDWLQQIEQRDRTLLDCRQTGTGCQVAATLLPLILFYHDLPHHLTAELTRTATLWLHPEESLGEVLLWGNAIAAIVREQINIAENMVQGFSHLPHDSPLIDRLQTALDRGASLQQTARIFSDLSPSQQDIALALYGFSLTPEDFSLCLYRVRQLSQSQPHSLALLLMGAISGIYNGTSGFLPSQFLFPQSQPILERSRSLFAAWSGCYRQDRNPHLLQTAIGTVGTIQPRKGFATISQRQSLDPSQSSKI